MTGEPVIRLPFYCWVSAKNQPHTVQWGSGTDATLNYFPKITVLEKWELAAM